MPSSNPNSNDAPHEVFYGPESQLKNLRVLLCRMANDLRASQELGLRLARRNISAMYRQSFLGVLWAFLPPLFTAAMFIALNNGGSITAKTTVPYTTWVMVGVFMWQVVSDSITSQLRSFSQSKQMLAKINFPRESIVLAGIYETVFAFLIRMLLLIPLLLWYGAIPGINLLWLPLGLMAILLIGTVAGVILGPISLFLQDIEKGVPLLLPLVMIGSGVVIPLPETGILGDFNRWNPIRISVDFCRDSILNIQPPPVLACLFVVGSFGFFSFMGWILFRIALPHAVSRIPS